MNVCIITSMIYCLDKPLSYSARRSVFSPEERRNQTRKSIESVRKYIPGSRVVLVEMSEYVHATLLEAADTVIYVGHKRLVRRACDSRHKGLGEAAGLLAAADALPGLGDYYFKLSGRYCLDDDFHLEQWARHGFTVRLYGKAISTRLYGFPAELLDKWRRALWRSLPWLALGRGLEYEMYRHLRRSSGFREMERLGVSGRVGPDGTGIRE